jgi:hypothetical protein
VTDFVSWLEADSLVRMLLDHCMIGSACVGWEMGWACNAVKAGVHWNVVDSSVTRLNDLNFCKLKCFIHHDTEISVIWSFDFASGAYLVHSASSAPMHIPKPYSLGHGPDVPALH